jgi:hypothetical protein
MANEFINIFKTMFHVVVECLEYLFFILKYYFYIFRLF